MAADPLLVLAVNRLPGYHGRPKRRVLESCRDEADFLLAASDYSDNSRHRGYGKSVDGIQLLRDAEIEYRQLRQRCIGYRILGETGYPASLAEISDPPFLLYHRGIFSETEKPPVAIVGTRRPTASGKREAYKLGLEFALAGYPVVSGLAFGIDRSSHEGALDAGGTTWAVLAGGLDRPGPSSHRPLARRILDSGGALLGEIPPGVYPAKYAFPRRNRILSGLCRGCVVVQAPKKSGALISADFALEQGRDLYVASSGVSDPAFPGTRALEESGAPVVSGAADVLADWGRFMDIHTVRNLSQPEAAADLVSRMKSELNGHIFRHMGGWFEYQGA